MRQEICLPFFVISGKRADVAGLKPISMLIDGQMAVGFQPDNASAAEEE